MNEKNNSGQDPENIRRMIPQTAFRTINGKNCLIKKNK